MERRRPSNQCRILPRVRICHFHEDLFVFPSSTLRLSAFGWLYLGFVLTAAAQPAAAPVDPAHAQAAKPPATASTAADMTFTREQVAAIIANSRKIIRAGSRK